MDMLDHADSRDPSHRDDSRGHPSQVIRVKTQPAGWDLLTEGSCSIPGLRPAKNIEKALAVSAGAEDYLPGLEVYRLPQAGSGQRIDVPIYGVLQSIARH